MRLIQIRRWSGGVGAVLDVPSGPIAVRLGGTLHSVSAKRFTLPSIVLAMSGSTGLVLSSFLLPWYAVGGWRTSIESMLNSEPSSSAQVGSMTLAYGGRWGFGDVTWGRVLLALACATACFSIAALVLRRSTRLNRVCLPCLLVLSMTLVVISMLEMTASPPFGDGPRLTSTFGAIIGVTAACLVAIASWVALATTRRGREPS